MQIYPNPVNQRLNVQYQSNANLRGSISLLSIDSRLIESFRNINFGNLNMQIDMAGLPKGLYLLKLETDKSLIVEKVIKQ